MTRVFISSRVVKYIHGYFVPVCTVGESTSATWGVRKTDIGCVRRCDATRNNYAHYTVIIFRSVHRRVLEYAAASHLLEQAVVPRVGGEGEDHASLGHAAQLLDHVCHLLNGNQFHQGRGYV